jgi:hypothetical protein
MDIEETEKDHSDAETESAGDGCRLECVWNTKKEMSGICRDWTLTSRTTSDQGENRQRDERTPLNPKKLNWCFHRGCKQGC